MKDTKSEIIAFWFEEIEPVKWFQKDESFDAAIRMRFEDDYHLAVKGIYDHWQNEPRSALALIILLDQFPRNMFRDTPLMFATDPKALGVARHVVDQGLDKDLDAARERKFIYLPFEHSEDIHDQKRAVALFETIKDVDPLGYEYAIKHLEVIEQFGRFPHRNAILGRENTPEEDVYLSDPQAGF